MLGIDYLKTSILDPTASCIEEMAGILDEVSEACNSAIDFMNNLLLYEKIDSMEMPLYLKREDLSALCEQIGKAFQMNARQLEVDFDVQVHESLTAPGSRGGGADSSCCFLAAVAEIDGPKVLIVLRNLISNALKFTPKGGQVTLSLTPVHIAPRHSSSSSGSGGGSSSGGSSNGGSSNGGGSSSSGGGSSSSSGSSSSGSSSSGSGGSSNGDGVGGGGCGVGVRLAASPPEATTHLRLVLNERHRAGHVAGGAAAALHQDCTILSQ
jgi:hypothetical protein